jgi:NAD(P)H-flavin reductase
MPTAVLSGRSDGGAGLLLVTLAVDDAVASKYVAPGQYVRITPAAGDAGYFVLASHPGDRAWELLVKNAGDAADLLASVPLGSAVEVSEPKGAGFPMSVARGRALAVAVAGSALAVARPILRERLAEDEAPRTTLFLGVRSAREVPLANEIEEWMSRGVRVCLCLSRAESAEDRGLFARAERFRGYVQDVLVSDARASAAGRSTLVFAAGPAPMLTALQSSELDVVANA